MRLKNKMISAAIVGSLSLVSIISVGTYAYFSSVATSSNNTIASGTLKLSSVREDMPISGPMFYTNGADDNGSVIGTREDGYWKPGIQKSKAIIITNDGTLPGKLESIKATLVSSSDHKQDINFENSLIIKVEAAKFITVKDSDGSKKLPTVKEVDALKKALMDAQNAYNKEETSTWSSDKKLSEMSKLYKEYITKALPNRVYFTPTSMFYMDGISGLFSDGVNIVDNPAADLESGECVALIYTIQFKNDLSNTQNNLQGKRFIIDFAHNYKQE